MKKRRLHKSFALIAAASLVIAACGGDDDDSGDESETEEEADTPAEEEAAEEEEEAADEAPAEDMELTASFRGVTEDTITVGISMLDFPGLVSTGLSAQGWGDQELVWQTYIDDLNDRGGINGRMVEAVYDFYSPIGTTEAEATCVKLTEDNETFAVLGGNLLGQSEL